MGSPAYAAFRKSVRQRDDNSCQWPGCPATKRLEVHHIRKWSAHPELRFEVSNGITLCKSCHSRVTGDEETYSTLFIKILEWKMLNKLKELGEEDG